MGYVCMYIKDKKVTNWNLQEKLKLNKHSKKKKENEQIDTKQRRISLFSLTFLYSLGFLHSLSVFLHCCWYWWMKGKKVHWFCCLWSVCWLVPLLHTQEREREWKERETKYIVHASIHIWKKAEQVRHA